MKIKRVIVQIVAENISFLTCIFVITIVAANSGYLPPNSYPTGYGNGGTTSNNQNRQQIFGTSSTDGTTGTASTATSETSSNSNSDQDSIDRISNNGSSNNNFGKQLF